MIHHDELCPVDVFQRSGAKGKEPGCQCPLIAEVRADEGDVYDRMEKWFTQQGFGVLELRRALGRYQ